MNVQNVSAYLPQQLSSTGQTAGQLQAGCQNHLAHQQSAAHPYPTDMPVGERQQWSRDIADLAVNAQDEFRRQLGNPTAELRAPQLQSALADLSTAQQAEAESAQSEVSGLKRHYWCQVGKTAGWMGATLAGLAATGVVPNPVTAGIAVVTGGLCIRSIVKARGAAKELGERVPQLESTARQANQLAAEASQCAVLVGAWNDLLGGGPAGQKAA